MGREYSVQNYDAGVIKGMEISEKHAPIDKLNININKPYI